MQNKEENQCKRNVNDAVNDAVKEPTLSELEIKRGAERFYASKHVKHTLECIMKRLEDELPDNICINRAWRIIKEEVGDKLT